MSKLSSNDVVLTIMKAFDSTVSGRTMLQKVGYFVGIATNTDLRYKPHYYGPYSPLIAATVSEQMDMGELAETAVAPTSSFVGHDSDRKFYSYLLTEAGQKACDIHHAWQPEEFDKAVEHAIRIKDTGANYMHLSLAAKVHYVLANSDEDTLDADDVAGVAESLGWSISEEDIEQGVDVLQKLGYMR